MVKYHFITFATPDHMSFAEANVKSALEVGGFDTAKIYTMNDIDDYFKAKNAHILNQPRGSGYWIWKPYIILKKLLEIDEGDILCYNDSKYLWSKNIRQFESDILTGKNIGVYKNKPNTGTYIEKEWTKFDALALMNIKHENNFRNDVINSNQVWAGFILLRKTFNPIRFIGEWLTYVQDHRIVTDSPSLFGPENANFKENRHDQSVLSLLCKKWSIPMHEMNKNDLINVRTPI
jgi:hypothetical protein